MIQNLEDAIKAGLKGKFIVMQSYFKKQEKSQTLTLHLKLLKKEEEEQQQQQKNPKVSRRGIGRNKWNRNKENNSKNKWNWKLVIWKNTQDRWTFSQTYQEQKGDNSNQ